MNADPPPEAVLRLFVALPLDPSVRRALAEVQARWRKAGLRAAWTPPPNLHLTLLFLGDTFAARLPALRAALDAAAAGIPPFRFEVRGLGSFGGARAPRVLWAGIPHPPPELARLAGAVGTAFEGARPPGPPRPFRPHITLGRPRGAPAVALTSAGLARIDKSYGWTRTDRVRLFRSVLRAQGAEHRAVHESLLKGT